MSLKSVSDRFQHVALRIAYRTSLVWIRLGGYRRPSVSVAVWHEREILLVRHSYKPGLTLPGGVMWIGEAPEKCAVRELAEELGINVSPDDLQLVGSEGVYSWFDYHVEEKPPLTPDGIEVIDARFVDSADARRYANLQRYFIARERAYS